jgi:hypothetical protein
MAVEAIYGCLPSKRLWAEKLMAEKWLLVADPFCIYFSAINFSANVFTTPATRTSRGASECGPHFHGAGVVCSQCAWTASYEWLPQPVTPHEEPPPSYVDHCPHFPQP